MTFYKYAKKKNQNFIIQIRKIINQFISFLEIKITIKTLSGGGMILKEKKH